MICADSWLGDLSPSPHTPAHPKAQYQNAGGDRSGRPWFPLGLPRSQPRTIHLCEPGLLGRRHEEGVKEGGREGTQPLWLASSGTSPLRLLGLSPRAPEECWGPGVRTAWYGPGWGQSAARSRHA